MRAPIEITLAGEAYRIRPLTVRQVRDLESVCLGEARHPSDQAAAIVEIALARDHSKVVLDEIEATAAELVVAMLAVLDLGGFAAAKPGEASAAAENASHGTKSPGA